MPPSGTLLYAQPQQVEEAYPKLVLALPDYETRRIVIASDEVIDGERVVCVAIKGSIRPSEEPAGQLSADVEVLTRSLMAITQHFNSFVGECMDQIEGLPLAPTRKALAQARACLPASCSHSFKPMAQEKALPAVPAGLSPNESTPSPEPAKVGAPVAWLAEQWGPSSNPHNIGGEWTTVSTTSDPTGWDGFRNARPLYAAQPAPISGTTEELRQILARLPKYRRTTRGQTLGPEEDFYAAADVEALFATKNPTKESK